MPVFNSAEKPQIIELGQLIDEPILSIESLSEVPKGRGIVTSDDIVTDDEVTTKQI